MDFININQLYYILRIIVAGICGICIGLERKNRFKEAGIRTHFIVAFASALIMVISKYAFADTQIGTLGVRGADGARIAAQVISGIGFLGAGMIFVHKNTVTGLTTAAGIWATSGIGLAIGGGMYIVGISGTIILIFAQLLLHKNFRLLKASKSKKLVVYDVTKADFQQALTEKLTKMGIAICDTYIEKTKRSLDYTFIIEVPENVAEEDIVQAINFDCRLTAS